MVAIVYTSLNCLAMEGYYRRLARYATSFIGGQGKKFGYLSNSDCFRLLEEENNSHIKHISYSASETQYDMVAEEVVPYDPNKNGPNSD